MTASTREEKLAKYAELLKLALAQVQAIEPYDQNKLSLIIERKWDIIRNLSGTKELLRLEPALAETIKKIEEADRLAERKLSIRMSQVRTRLCNMNKQNAARKIYGQIARKKHPILGLAIDDNTPRFFDIQS